MRRTCALRAWLHPQQRRSGGTRPCAEPTMTEAPHLVVERGADARAWVLAAASRLLEHGVCQIRGALGKEVLEPLRVAHDRRAAEVVAGLEEAREARCRRSGADGGAAAAPSEFETACIRPG